MNKKDTVKKIKELSQELKKHNYKYYFLSSPVITDKEYDDLLKELISLEEQYPELINKDSPSQTVGYKDGF